MDEKKLRELVGQQKPFKVPEGYFEDFNERLLARLPQQQKAKTVSLRPKLWRYAAAVVVAIGLGAALYISQSEENTTVYASQEEYYNEALDYVMVGNTEIAAYLTAAE